MLKIAVSNETLAPLSKGHPWVWKGSFRERPEPGTPLLLTDKHGKVAAFALADQGDIIARVLGKSPDRIPDLIRRRIHLAKSIRSRILPPNTNAYRLVNGPGDDLPGLVVDRYGPLAVLRLYGKCWDPWIDSILDALESVDGIEQIYRRFGVRRVDGKKGGEALSGGEPPESLIVSEYGLKFIVRPRSGQKTGLFLDQREHRRFLGERSKGLRVANLFAYTGGFSVYAAAGGAKSVCTVDIAAQAIDDAKINFKLNGLDPNRHSFEVADAFKWQSDNTLDLLICDPPSLSHGRKSDKRSADAYRDLAMTCGKMLPKGGLLATASCTARLSRERWERMVIQGLSKTGRWSWLWRADEPPDHPVGMAHPEGRYLKFSLLARTR